ncbi:MAG: hypothetical protein AYK18_15975 [Theionarchaea archaeon DG-70]|nr:MAG: hypothetical protein AYK18_15975 [Theionarchaea archaeon DG-70]
MHKKDRTKNTLKNYFATLNCIVSKVKKPFSETTFKNLLYVLQKWNEKSLPIARGRKGEHKTFLRWKVEISMTPVLCIMGLL